MSGIVSLINCNCSTDHVEYPPLPLHPSMDMVSILNLKPQFERFVRPYLPPHILQPDLHPQPNKDDGLEAEAGENGPGGKKKKKKDGNVRRLEKGYEGIIEECIGKSSLEVSHLTYKILHRYLPPIRFAGC